MKRNRREVNRVLLCIVAAAVVTCARPLSEATALSQQGGTTHYVYDDNGRLRAVVTPAGEAAVYEYDPAGNITAVRRVSADTLSLLGFFPTEGGLGDQVVFVGTGFNAGVTSVSFNGASANILQVTPGAVTAEVPDAATTGPVTITTPRGVLITPIPFTVVSRVRVFPPTATITPGESVQFTAVLGSGDSAFRWSVNGVEGGSVTTGTITQTGLYTAPSLAGNNSLTVTVRATSTADDTLFGEGTVKVLNPNSLGALIARSVSVSKGNPPAVAAARAPLVSVRPGVFIGGPAVAQSHPVSVQRGLAISGPFAVLNPLLSVRFGPSPSTLFSPFVLVTTGPAISSISPSTVSRGSTVTVTITGENLAGVSAIRFLNSSGLLDANVAASNIAISPDGTTVTASVAVGTSATIGEHIVVVTASAGTTPAIKAGPNTITIQ